jgi:hypothetical protein
MSGYKEHRRIIKALENLLKQEKTAAGKQKIFERMEEVNLQMAKSLNVELNAPTGGGRD